MNGRADDCVEETRIAMHMAEKSIERGDRSRHLKAVLGWLKLVTKFRLPRSFQNCDHVRESSDSLTGLKRAQQYGVSIAWRKCPWVTKS